LAARFNKDFEWLRVENRELYDHVQELVNLARWTRGSIIGLATDVGYFIWELKHKEVEWHLANYRDVVQKINQYETNSNNDIARLHQISNEVGVSLLTTSEYEEALATDGSIDPNLIVIGEVTMGDKYINKGQAGAFGRTASAGDMSFQQTWNQLSDSTSLEKLVIELENLRQHMKDRAHEPEHYLAIAEVVKAEKAAKENDGVQVVKSLKTAGKWTLDTATDIGTSIVVEIIKKSMGM
jgi:hypothetical protein